MTTAARAMATWWCLLKIETMQTKLKTLIGWGAVLKLCDRASVGEYTARKLFWRAESPARKLLPGMTRARYVRAVVLRELGLPDE